jgi:large subunit ribosomal protein L21
MAEVKTTKKPVVKTEETKSAPKAAVKAEPKKADKPAPSVAERFAVIKTGGKQYVVEEGRWYEFEKLAVDEGKDVVFEEVLLISDKGSAKIGAPFIKDAKVTGTVLEQFKDEKVIVFKYKPKKRTRKTQGHRQQLTKVKITKIA